MPKITFRDHFKLEMPSAERLQEFKDSVSAGGHRSLRVRIEATHAGITNKNNRFYIPSRMRDGAEEFVKGKPAPILKHHKADEDPVGKVRAFEYIDTTPEVLRSSPEVAVLNDGKADLKKQVQAARKFINSGITSTDGWKGLGNVMLYADIMDEGAIKQLETGLFDAVSIGFASDHAFCSICYKDWMNDEEGLCEHFPPGKVYKDENGNSEHHYLIPGNMFPRELSLVNFDADPHTNITLAGHHFGDAEGDVEVQLGNVKQDVLFDAKMTWEVRDSEEAAIMEIKTNDGAVIELSDTEKKIFDIVKAKNPDAVDSIVAENAKKIAALRDEEGFLPDQKEAELDEETAVLYAYDALVGGSEEVNEDAHYEDLIKELQAMVDEGVITAKEMEDAKLSGEQRKGLSKGTFCGPDRSFPVPDCAHVTAARRLIGRYKGPGSKTNILACVARKAKALGCSGGSKGDSTPVPTGEEEAPCNQLTKLGDKELHDLFHSVEMELISRKLKVQRECSDCATNLKSAEDSKKEKEEAIGKLTANEQIVSILRDELRTWAFDYKAAIDDSVEVRFELETLKRKFASIVSVLAKKHDDVEKAEAFFKDAEDFDKEYTTLLKDFSAKEVFDKLNDGTHHDPKGTVKDPTVNEDADNKQHPEGLSKPALAVIDRIKEMIEDGERVQAKRLFAKMKSYGIFDKSMDFETIISSANDAAE
jgi:hypothetical protein